MIDESIYIILERQSYNTIEEARQQIIDCYSNLLGIIPIQDEGKWYIVRVKSTML